MAVTVVETVVVVFTVAVVAMEAAAFTVVEATAVAHFTAAVVTAAATSTAEDTGPTTRRIRRLPRWHEWRLRPQWKDGREFFRTRRLGLFRTRRRLTGNASSGWHGFAGSGGAAGTGRSGGARLPMANGTPSAHTAPIPRRSPRSIAPASLPTVLRRGTAVGDGAEDGAGWRLGLDGGWGWGGCWGCGWGWGFGSWSPVWAPSGTGRPTSTTRGGTMATQAITTSIPRLLRAAQSSDGQQNVVDQARTADIRGDRD